MFFVIISGCTKVVEAAHIAMIVSEAANSEKISSEKNTNFEALNESCQKNYLYVLILEILNIFQELIKLDICKYYLL